MHIPSIPHICTIPLTCTYVIIPSIDRRSSGRLKLCCTALLMKSVPDCTHVIIPPLDGSSSGRLKLCCTASLKADNGIVLLMGERK